MTDSEMLAEILKNVREIRSYISRQRDCPQHLWDAERQSEERARQNAANGRPYYEGIQDQLREPSLYRR